MQKGRGLPPSLFTPKPLVALKSGRASYPRKRVFVFFRTNPPRIYSGRWAVCYSSPAFSRIRLTMSDLVRLGLANICIVLPS